MKQVFLHVPSLKTCVDKLFIFAICHTSSLNEILEFPLDRILWLHKMDLWQGGTTPPLWSLALSHATRIFIETDFETFFQYLLWANIKTGGREGKITLEMEVALFHILFTLLTVQNTSYSAYTAFWSKRTIMPKLTKWVFSFLCLWTVSVGWMEWDRIIPI